MAGEGDESSHASRRSSDDSSKIDLDLAFDNVRLEEGEEFNAGLEEEEGPPPPLHGVPEEPPVPTLAEKCLFYVTAFFILLAVFSLFAFLFLVPFVIDPAFTTIFMEFDPEPALCFTVSSVAVKGVAKCKVWSSCREGCTREVFECHQIRVNYRARPLTDVVDPDPHAARKKHKLPGNAAGEVSRPLEESWTGRDAHLYPNVKGCGYPPAIVCADFVKAYGRLGRNFSCYYSRVNPGLVVTNFDMNQVVLDLIYSLAIPIPSFLLSVVYLVFAYFRIYNSPAPPPSTPPSPTNNNGGDPDSDKPKIELNDLGPPPPDPDTLLPRRNNRAPERNGPTNPAAKIKGGEPTLLGGFEETDF